MIDQIIREIDVILLKVFSPLRWNKLTAKLQGLLSETWSVQQQLAIEQAIRQLENAGEAFNAEDLELTIATLEEYLLVTVERACWRFSGRDPAVNV